MKTKTEIERESIAAAEALIEAIRQAADQIKPAGRTLGSFLGSFAWKATAAAERMGMAPTDLTGDEGKAVMGAILDTLKSDRDFTAVPKDPVWFRVGQIASAASKQVIDRAGGGHDEEEDRASYVRKLARRFRHDLK